MGRRLWETLLDKVKRQMGLFRVDSFCSTDPEEAAREPHTIEGLKPIVGRLRDFP